VDLFKSGTEWATITLSNFAQIEKQMRKLLCASVMFGLVFVVSCSSSPPKQSVNAVKAASDSTVVQPDPQRQPEETFTPPEVVRSEEVRIENGLKTLTVGNSHGHYHLWCNIKANACVTPMPGKDYLVFSKTTRWRFGASKEVATLKFFQDFSVIYNNQENIALVPADDGPFGTYARLSWSKNN